MLGYSSNYISKASIVSKPGFCFDWVMKCCTFGFDFADMVIGALIELLSELLLEL